MRLFSVNVVAMIVVIFVIGYASYAFALSEADFQAIARKYGVSPLLLKAISVAETQNGLILGNHEVKQVIDEVQLKYLKKIARHTKRPLSDFKGSYAGAMGHMQVIPSTFYVYAQDGDGDGIKDPLNPYDSLATAAYFVARQVALKTELRAVLRRYNNSDEYCEKVLALYHKFEVESKLAAR